MTPMAAPAGIPKEDADWARRSIERHLGAARLSIDVEAIPSRLATVHRITVQTADGTRRFYLKRYPADVLAGDFTHRADDLSSLARAVRGAGLLPFAVVAAEPARRLLLAEETKGSPLGHLHRRLVWSPAARAAALAAWQGVGAWLAVLHRQSIAPKPSPTRAAELVSYTNARFEMWGAEEPASAQLAQRAAETVQRMGAALEGRGVTLTPCHGDVTTFNILVGKAGVGLIDLDDFRFDMPAIDISQALLELDQFSRFGGVASLARFRARARARLEHGYGHPFPQGSEFWLPHFRNLSVFILTLARRRTGVTISRLSNAAHYARLRAELARSLEQASREGGGA